MREIEVSGKDLASAFGVSDRSIREFADRGIIEKVGRGKYKLLQSVRLYTAHLREVAAGRGGEAGVLDLTAERVRHAKEQADNLALKNAALRRDLVPVADVEREWITVARQIRSGVMAVPSRVRQSLPHLTAYDADVIDREIRDALTGLGEHDGDHEIALGGLVQPDAATKAETVGMD
jgi:phage terminase Nu1 subunit (DNA packaging protein)